MNVGFQGTKLRTWAGWLFLSSLFFFLPFVSSSQTVEHELSIRFLWFSILISIAFVCIIIDLWNKHDHYSFLQTSVGKYWSIFILVGFVSGLFSLTIREAFAENLKNCIGFICAFTFYYFLQTDTSFKEKCAVAIGVFLVAILAVGSYQAVYQKETFYSFKDLVSTLSNPNLFASMLVICLPFVYLLYITQPNRFVKILAILLGIAVLGFVLVLKSKSSILALGIGLTSVGVAYVYLKGLLKSSRSIGYLAIILLPISIVISYYLWSNYSTKVSELIFFDSAKKETFDGNIERILLWRNSVKMILEYPFLGVGPGHWKLYFPKYGVSGWYLDKSLIQFSAPHNDYLWILSEYGVLGFAAFLGIISITIKGFWSKLSSGKSEDIGLNMALLGGFVAYLSDSFFSYPHERPMHVILFSVYVAFSLPQQVVDEYKRIPIRAVLIALLMIALIGSYIFFFRFSAEKHLQKSREARDSKLWEVCVKESEKAEKLGLDYTPFYVEPVALTQGMAYDELGKTEAAYEKYERAYKAAPFHLYSMVQYAGALYGQGRERECIEILNQTQRITPGFWFTWRLRSLILLRKNDIEGSWIALNSSSWVNEFEYNEMSREIFKARLIKVYETLPEKNEYLDCLKLILEKDSIPLVIEKQYHSEEGVMKWLYNFRQLFCK